MSLAESDVEKAALEWFGEEGLRYTYLHGTQVSPAGPDAARESYSEVVLGKILHRTIGYLNPYLSPEAVQEVYNRVTRLDYPTPLEQNRAFHKMLVEGVTVENRRLDGSLRSELAMLVDFTHFDKNDWLVVNQFTVTEQSERRPDVVVFVNGLPLVVIELKNPGDEQATLKGAFQQLQTYKEQIPSLMAYNEVLVVSDGVEARAGTLTSNWERFQIWRTVDGETLAPKSKLELETLILGLFEPKRFLDMLRSFIVFEVDGEKIDKKMAAYHQYYAVNRAVATTMKAAALDGDRRAGVVWHTQGSGKSLTMVFYAGKLIQQMQNPTLVVLTDRNDLDDQLFDTFSHCQSILRQKPDQANSRADIETLLGNRASGGVIFTTIQKFFPQEGSDFKELSARHNIVIIADEAHRSQYGLEMHLVKNKASDEWHKSYGFAKYLRDALPNASYIGFTGTPIESDDKSTRAIFGDYIDIYDVHRSVEDGATLRIYYEARTVPLALDESERPQIDPRFEEVTEGEELEEKEKLKSRWGRQEALVGADDRIEKVAADIVQHFELRQQALEGKAMIVCMSRRICVDLYEEIIKLRPDWHNSDDKKGFIKVVMTGSATDAAAWQQHIRSKGGREAIANRFKDAADPLSLVIVRDMWLTGFDVPCLHTMYLDKYMKGHGLMQAIARVNRVFKDKPGGLIVDYLGLAEALKNALHDYSPTDRAETAIDQDRAVAIMQEKYEVVRALFYGFDYSDFFSDRSTVKLSVIPSAMDHILKQDEGEKGKKRYMQAVTELSKAYALAIPHEEALRLRDEIGFFQVVRASFIKSTPSSGKTQEDLDTAVRQIISQAIAADGAIDLYATLGVKNPSIDLFSSEFLDKMRNLPQQRLAFEMLNKLINDQIKTRFRRNVVKAQSFEAKLDKAIKLYQERAIEAALTMLRANAEELRDTLLADARLGLSEDSLAFYDALKAGNVEALEIEDQKLRTIAESLVTVVKENVSPDWTIRQSTRSHLSRTIRRFLRQNGYPSDKQNLNTVVELLMKQAEALSQDWNIA